MACRSEFVTADAAGGSEYFHWMGRALGGASLDVRRSLRAKSETEVTMPHAMTWRSILANQISTGLSQEE